MQKWPNNTAKNGNCVQIIIGKCYIAKLRDWNLNLQTSSSTPHAHSWIVCNEPWVWIPVNLDDGWVTAATATTNPAKKKAILWDKVINLSFLYQPDHSPLPELQIQGGQALQIGHQGAFYQLNSQVPPDHNGCAAGKKRILFSRRLISWQIITWTLNNTKNFIVSLENKINPVDSSLRRRKVQIGSRKPVP